MTVQQLSVFVENKSGRMAEITAAVAEGNIDIRALSIADTTDFGILRLIVDRPQEAEDYLKGRGMTVSLTNVIAVRIEDRPGGFAEAIRVLANEGIDVEYMYAFVCRQEGYACVIVRVNNNEKAVQILKDNGIGILTQEEIINM